MDPLDQRAEVTVAAVPRAGRREWVGLGVLTLACLLYAMDLTVLHLAVPSLSAALQPSSAQLLWITDIYGFMVAGFLVTMGTLGDRIGRRHPGLPAQLPDRRPRAGAGAAAARGCPAGRLAPGPPGRPTGPGAPAPRRPPGANRVEAPCPHRPAPARPRPHPGRAAGGPERPRAGRRLAAPKGGHPMPRPHHLPPDPEPDGCWPSCDEAGPGVSIRPLRHSDLPALVAHRTHDQHQDQQPGHDQGAGWRVGPAGWPPAAGRPMVALRVRASIGRPGASAHAQYRRRRALELAAWRRGLPWRVAALLAAAVAAGLLAAQLAPHLTPLALMLAAAGLGSQMRFRPGPETRAWRRGAKGERRTARLLAPLERHGWAVLHDLAIPGSAANIDHLVIGPGGVLVIDTKRYRGRLWLDGYGMLWQGRHLLVSALRKVRWAADQADAVLGIADLQIAAIVAVHGASVPWGALRSEGVTVVPAQRLPDLLGALPPVLGPERVAWLADRARLRFRPAT
jgi:Nuclease-related domain